MLNVNVKTEMNEFFVNHFSLRLHESILFLFVCLQDRKLNIIAF